jgi:type I restriction enzyme M protein
MSTATHDIIAKLWNLCNVLKDGGISFHQYMIELTYLLFLKMAKETRAENQIPEGYRWNDLKSRSDSEQIGFYKQLLNHLGEEGSVIVKAIFADAKSSINKSNTLSALVSGIDKLD